MSTTKDDRYLELNPDAFTRFYICKEILKKDFGKKPIKILDVGGGSKYFRSALLQDKLPYELTVIDILPKPEELTGYTYVQGDATKMKFVDGSFDAVVSMDVLEHVADEKKVAFIQECYRVAKDLVVIAGPFESPETTEAEEFGNDFFRSLHGREHPWLIEHFEQNKPTKELMETQIKKLGCQYLEFEGNHLPSWLRLLLVNFIPESIIDYKKVRQLNRFYNENFLSLNDFATPGYRHFYLLYKNPTLKKEFNDYFSPEVSISRQLILEHKITDIFASELVGLRLEAHQKEGQLKAASTEIRELTTRLEDTARHAGNLQTMLDDVHNSKAYKLANRLRGISRKVTGK